MQPGDARERDAPEQRRKIHGGGEAGFDLFGVLGFQGKRESGSGRGLCPFEAVPQRRECFGSGVAMADGFEFRDDRGEVQERENGEETVEVASVESRGSRFGCDAGEAPFLFVIAAAGQGCAEVSQGEKGRFVDGCGFPRAGMHARQRQQPVDGQRAVFLAGEQVFFIEGDCGDRRCHFDGRVRIRQEGHAVSIDRERRVLGIAHQAGPQVRMAAPREAAGQRRRAERAVLLVAVGNNGRDGRLVRPRILEC